MQEQLKRMVDLSERSHASFEAFYQKRDKASVCSITEIMEVCECSAISGTN